MQDILAKFLMIKCRVAFCIYFLRIRIQHLRMTTNPDPDPGLSWPKIEKNLQLKIFCIYFLIKNCNLPIPKPPESYRRSLQLSKEAIQHFKTWTFTNFYFCGSFFCPPGSGFRIRIHRPDWIRIQSKSATLIRWLYSIYN